MGFLKTTVGKKYVVAITGLGWALFVLTHMAGNLLLFVGPEAYNRYGHALTSNPLIYVAEAGLVAILVLHVVFTISLSRQNKAAKPTGYAVTAAGAKRTDWIAKTMIVQGPLILFFIITHLKTFKFGEVYMVNYEGVEMRDLHRLMVEVFQDPGYVVGYIFALFLLGIHLRHGFASTFSTLGITSARFQKPIQVVSTFYGLIVAGGFMSQPIYIFLILS